MISTYLEHQKRHRPALEDFETIPLSYCDLLEVGNSATKCFD